MRTAAVCVLSLLLFSCASGGDVAPAALNPDSDEFQIRATILAVYNVISGPAGRHDWDRFAELFAPGAQIVNAGSAYGDEPIVMTTAQYIERMKPQLEQSGTFERPIATTVTEYARTAHAWSVFEIRRESGQAEPTARGVNSFTLVNIGGQWKVQSIVRQRENAGMSIPAQFLSGR